MKSDTKHSSIKKTAGVLLIRMRNENPQILLVYNGRNWSIPKGVVSKGESVKRAAKRELYEETGLEPRGRLAHIGSVRKGKSELLECYMGQHKKGKPQPLNEIAHVRFFDLRKASKLIQDYQNPLISLVMLDNIQSGRSA
jgi:ADP-ribose pyrophosphatase YjhB (NUDIX family)